MKRSRTCWLFILPGYLRAQPNLEGGALPRHDRQSSSDRARRARPPILVGYGSHYLAHIRNRYRDYFVGRGQTGKNFAHAILTQSAHAQLARALPQEESRDPFIDHMPHFVVDDEDLENSHPAPVAGMPAMFAAGGLHHLGVFHLRRLDPERAHFRFTQVRWMFAMST